MHEDLVQIINQAVPEAKAVLNKAEVGDSSISINAETIYKVCETLKKNDKYEFNVLQVISGTDYLPEGEEGYLELAYILASFTKNHEVIIKTKLPRGTDSNLPKIDSLCGLWRAANWQERETYDMIGVEFVGHPDLRRILTSSNWEGHPLRKDYKVQEIFNGMVVNPPGKMNLGDQQFGVKSNADSLSNKKPMGL
ncbi:MAG: NADH-quinone oxidoreductase subunit C [Epsilonproteobacteria bacterium]|nr:MAG: NADH-quinone oxidoreductase subunit C [Campylobacterota bacterium]RLA64036.1 MAG: NADH-quinone oxidoreductase subunit C [Campylobacterota bacterium]